MIASPRRDGLGTRALGPKPLGPRKVQRINWIRSARSHPYTMPCRSSFVSFGSRPVMNDSVLYQQAHHEAIQVRVTSSDSYLFPPFKGIPVRGPAADSEMVKKIRRTRVGITNWWCGARGLPNKNPKKKHRFLCVFGNDAFFSFFHHFRCPKRHIQDLQN